MAIRVKHSPSAASIGNVAYYGGRGRYEERREDANTAADLRQKQINNQATATALNFKAQSDKTSLAADQQKFEQNLQTERMGIELKKRMEKTKELDEENYFWAHTPKQKARIEAIDNNINGILESVAANETTAEDGETALREQRALRGSILVQKMEGDPSPSQQAESMRVLNSDKSWGGLMFDPKKGTTYLDPAWEYKMNVQAKAADAQFAYEDMLLKMTDKDFSGNEKPRYTPEQASEMSARRFPTGSKPVSEGPSQEQQRQAQIQQQQDEIRENAKGVETPLEDFFKGMAQNTKKTRKGGGWGDETLGKAQVADGLKSYVEYLVKERGYMPDEAERKAIDKYEALRDAESGDVWHKYPAREDGKNKGMADVAPKTATNTETGTRIISNDGGKTWQPIQ